MYSYISTDTHTFDVFNKLDLIWFDHISRNELISLE